MTIKTPDEVADDARELMTNLHALIDGSDHPRKARLQRLANVAHGALSDIGEIVNDSTGTGDIAARAGDDKD